MSQMPTQCFARAAGIAVPLFSLRGTQDFGSGGILDLIPFIDWCARWHQRVVQLLPINETASGEASPYNTLSAFAIDPTYISTQQVVDVAESRTARTWLKSRAAREQMRRAHRSTRRIRSAVHALKLRLLEFGFEHFEGDHDRRTNAFERFCADNAWWLDEYALFRALKERHSWTSWEMWPAPLRERDPSVLDQTRTALGTRLRFFRYIQWIAAQQWEMVRVHARMRGVLVKGDLPFVCGRDSADVWAYPELFDLSSSAGAPPDAFSPTGQAWGLPLYNWEAMRATGYAWWRQRARQARGLYDLFRVDHVVGLYRTYAIPTREGGTSGFVPREQTDQLQQGHDLLSGVLEESGVDVGVIAEDLGTVPDWVRASLTQLRVPGYKVFRWETYGGTYLDPRTYPPLSVATTGTHDTDTLCDWWQELDREERAAVVRSLDLGEIGLHREDDGAVPWTPGLHLALLQRLYEAGSVLTILPIQDLFGWRDRINTPATIDPQNWSYRLPAETAKLDQIPEVRERMAAVRAFIDRNGRHAIHNAPPPPAIHRHSNGGEIMSYDEVYRNFR